MNELKAITQRLEEDIMKDPQSWSCVPYQNAHASSAPEEGSQQNNRLPLCETGQRILGQQYVNLDLYPPPNRQAPRMKTELRGGRLFDKCECVKRNGLQDSCLCYRCMVNLNQGGCDTLPHPSCPLGKRQIAKYEALPDRSPDYCRNERPPCPGAENPSKRKPDPF